MMLEIIGLIVLKVLFYYVIVQVLAFPVILVGNVAMASGGLFMRVLSFIFITAMLSVIVFGCFDVLTDVYPLITGGIK